MAKAEWGAKRQCPNCGAKFYDLNKSHPITCPKCAHKFEADVWLKPRKAKLELKDTAPAVVADEEEELAETEAEGDGLEEEAAEDEEEELAEPLLAEELEDDVPGVPTSDDDEELEDNVVLEDDGDLDEALIETDEDLVDEEVVDIPDPEEKDI